MFDGHWRETVEKGVDPIGVALRRAGVTADVLTVTGILVAIAGAFVVGNGYLRLGFVFLVLSGVPDLLDGAVAKAAGTSSKRGAFFDSTSDRVSDAFLFGGIAWFLASDAEYRDSRIMLLPMAVLASAMVISYMRAKGELLGFDGKGGIMERAERFIAVSVGLIFPEILIPVLWVMLALTIVTAGQRFTKIWKQATTVMPEPSPLPDTPTRAQRRAERATRPASAERRANRKSTRR